jgi:hypothetical protein
VERLLKIGRDTLAFGGRDPEDAAAIEVEIRRTRDSVHRGGKPCSALTEWVHTARDHFETDTRWRPQHGTRGRNAR